MKILKIILLILLTTGIQAKSNKWKPLKYIDDYPMSAFKLKKGVEYLEIRQYRVNEKDKIKETSIIASLYRIPLDSFDQKIVKKFRKLTPNLTAHNNMCCLGSQRTGIECYYKYNGFMIDNNGKMWRMTTIENVIEFLGDIDTPAEVQAVLWLHNKNGGNSYRKTSKGYDVIIEFDDEINYCKSFKYRASINKKGKIVKYKLLKSKKLKQGCHSVSIDVPCVEY